VAKKMANTLCGPAAPALNIARDFSCCIVTRDNRCCAADSLPIHVLSGPDLMCAAKQQFHPKLKRGDAFSAQLALSRLLAIRPTTLAGAGVRPGRHASLHRGWPRPSGGLRQLDPDDLHGRGARRL